MKVKKDKAHEDRQRHDENETPKDALAHDIFQRTHCLASGIFDGLKKHAEGRSLLAGRGGTHPRRTIRQKLDAIAQQQNTDHAAKGKKQPAK